MRLKREAEPALDRAQYLAVATGRMDPYLRELAVIQVYLPLPAQCSQADGIDFYHVYTTELRALYHRGSARGILPEVVGFEAENIADVVHREDGESIGLLIDPDLPSELTLEPGSLQQVGPLRQGRAIPPALSPIAWESLRPLEFSKTDIPTPIRGYIGERLAEVAHLELIGHGGHSWWVVRFFEGDDTAPKAAAVSPESIPWLAVIHGREPAWLEQELVDIPFTTV